VAVHVQPKAAVAEIDHLVDVHQFVSIQSLKSFITILVDLQSVGSTGTGNLPIQIQLLNTGYSYFKY
jgi:hypothetical protein